MREKEREREDEWASVLWNDELIFFLCIFGMTAIPIIGVGMRDFTCNIVIKTNKKRKSRRGNIFFVFGSCNLYYTLYIFFCNFIFIIFSVFFHVLFYFFRLGLAVFFNNKRFWLRLITMLMMMIMSNFFQLCQCIFTNSLVSSCVCLSLFRLFSFNSILSICNLICIKR